MKPRIQIDVVSDVVCPWCFVGEHRLAKAVARIADRADVGIVQHPFLLDPDVPQEGGELVDYLTRKYGRPPDQTWDRLQAEAAASGLELDMRRQKRRYPTVDAHTLIRHAAGKGTQVAVARDLARANFVEALNIADHEVLAEIAERFGFDRQEATDLLDDPGEAAKTRSEAGSVAAQGVSGVPFFIFDRRFALSGCQPEEVFDRALAAALEAVPAEAGI